MELKMKPKVSMRKYWWVSIMIGVFSLISSAGGLSFTVLVVIQIIQQFVINYSDLQPNLQTGRWGIQKQSSKSD